MSSLFILISSSMAIYSILELFEDVGDYCISVDEAFVKGVNVPPPSYNTERNGDLLIYEHGSFKCLSESMCRHSSLFNIFIPFDPTDLIVTISILCV